MAQEDPGKKPGRPGPNRPEVPRTNWRFFLLYAPLVIVLLWIWQEFVATGGTTKVIPYSVFKEFLAKGQVEEVQIREGTEILGVIDPTIGAAGSSQSESKAKAPSPPAAGKAPTARGSEGKTAAAKDAEASADALPNERFNFRTVPPSPESDRDLLAQLEKRGVKKYTFTQPGLLSSFLIAWLLPILLIVVVWFFLFRRLGSAGQAVMSIGKSRARMVADKETGVTFADVAGCDEAKYELQEVVDFLQNPARYQALGAKIPKGVLLVGPPGTGKTLMARAVAGEAHAPFFSISGSDFVEMFVGVGAARVRDLFEQAKSHAPCIIFIDELDAIGRQRGVHLGPVNDEREQTLNQLLVEMDGFEANVGVILLAATNRPDVLDRALLRPGRFDRQVVVDAPDVDGREAILKVHSQGKPLARGVNLRAIAQATVGFSGADLANALNEAALLAARRGASEIVQTDLEEAIEKLVAGPERTSRRLDAEQKRRVAYHEVGHALVAAYSKHADPVHKISIVPRGRAALGYTLQLPTAEQFIMTRSALLDRIRGLLGGRAAEEVAFDEVSTGAENDLERATAMARQMVCMFGMSDEVGLIHCATREGEYFGGPQFGPSRDWSEDTTRQVDQEVKRILDEAHQAARQILVDHREQLERVVEELLKRESLDAAAFHLLIGREYHPAGEEPATNDPAPDGKPVDGKPADGLIAAPQSDGDAPAAGPPASLT